VTDQDGKPYKTVVIGTQTWMAENLNYAVTGSKCGTDEGTIIDENTTFCDTYGRLYDWTTAMNGSTSSNNTPSGVQGVCPADWHLPSRAEWTVLVNYVGATMAGAKLKATSGWVFKGSNGDVLEDNVSNGTDEYGFSALPGGYRMNNGFIRAGSNGIWWTSTQYNNNNSYYYRGMSAGSNLYDVDIGGYVPIPVNGVSDLTAVMSDYYSVRCVKNEP